MVDVFVSRPTWVPDLFKPGLDGFRRTLSDLGLNPRTIGTTDYPVEGSFDAVMRVMNECDGAVILGYPQIWIREGTVKQAEVESEMTLPTEWNHIEAALALALGKPVLVIRDVGISGGVFDHGAGNNFIYEEDLSNSGWPISERIHGALESWKETISKSRIVESAPVPVEDSVSDAVELEISDDTHVEIQVLQVVIHLEPVIPDSVGDVLGMGAQKARFYLDALKDQRLIQASFSLGGPPRFMLRQAGRKLLMQHGLLD